MSSFLLLFGDSITAGRGVRQKESYAGLLASFFEQDRADVHICNFGVPGDTTQGLVARIAQECDSALSHAERNDWVGILIAIGTNDGRADKQEDGRSWSCQRTAQNLKSIVAIARRYTRNVVFLDLPPMDEQRLRESTGILLSASAHKGVRSAIRSCCFQNALTLLEQQSVWGTDGRAILAGDGLHMNEIGHKAIFFAVRSWMDSCNRTRGHPGPGYGPMTVLQNEYTLSAEDCTRLQKRFPYSFNFSSQLFLGGFRDEAPTCIVGAPCIRKDIGGISLNTVYQTLLPMLVAKHYRVSCKIFLGVQEEILIQPEQQQRYIRLGGHLAKQIQGYAQVYGVDVELVNTAEERCHRMIEEAMQKLNVHMSTEESTYLHQLRQPPLQRALHSPARKHASERVVVCNTGSLLEQFFGQHQFLLVEDVEQYPPTDVATRFDHGASPNFLGFVPLPSVSGRSNMLAASGDDRILMQESTATYETQFRHMPGWVMNFYAAFFQTAEILLEGGDAAAYARSLALLARQCEEPGILG